MYRNFLLYIILLVAFVRCKTIEVKKTTLADDIGSGSVYKLPKTQLQFEINIKTTTYTNSALGCFTNYEKYFKGVVAPKLLNELRGKANDQPLVTSKVTSAIISPIPIDDEEKVFTINTKNKALHKHIYGLNLDDNGILNRGEFSSENLALPIVSQIISSAAGFISPISQTRGAKDANENLCKEFYEKYEELDKAKSDFMFLSNFRNASELPTKELYERVLAEYEKDKLNIFTQLMFSTEVQQDKVIVRFTPTASDVDLVNGKIVFGFKKNGDKGEIHINKDLIGSISSFVIASPGVSVVESDAATLKTAKDLKLYYLKIVPMGSDKAKLETIQKDPSTNLKTAAAGTDAGGIFYNLPLNCKVYLQQGENKNWSEATIMLPQWGSLGRLSNKTANQVVELNPLYGNLKSVKEQNQSVSPDQIKTFGQSLAEARDVFYTDPVTKMERRIKYLETQAKLTEAGGTELSELRKQVEVLKAQKEALELKKALKEFEQ